MATKTADTFEFKTEIKELLHLIVHTLYTHKEIFLRELLANASDALSKVQFESLTNPDIFDKDQALEIKLAIDKKKRTILVEDTGVGMSREALIEQIGTIAHSGTKRFMKELADAQKSKKKKSLPDLIGQFGVGFYSVFMVADKVTIDTKSLDKDEPAVHWESDGSGSYTMGESERRKRGTAITIHLKKEEKEFLEEDRIKNLVNQYANYLPFPVLLGKDRINEAEAIWRKTAKQVKDEDYNKFYREISNDWQDPLLTEHFRADAPVQFSSILYVPKTPPVEYFGQADRPHGLKLYVKRVFIQNDCKPLIPPFLRFLKGVVESEDLPLNVSRETIQNDANITKINKILTKKFLDALNKMAKKKEDEYLVFWTQFGKFIKEGIHSEASYKDKLLPLLRYYSTKNSDKQTVSLKSYADGMAEDQKVIYYAVGESLDQLRRSPHVELFLKNDIEVLLVVEPLDDMVFNHLGEYDGKKLVNVESGDLQLPEKLKKDIESVEVGEDLNKLKDKVKDVLKDKIQEVRFSKALTDSPCKFYNASGGMSHSVKKMMSDLGNMGGMGGMGGMPLKRDLELNPEHQFIKSLAGRLETESFSDQVHLLYHMASLLEGSLEEPQELASLILPLLR